MTWIKLNKTIPAVLDSIAIEVENSPDLFEPVDVRLVKYRLAGISVRELGEWPVWQGMTSVYRFFDGRGLLLYVGITQNSVRTRIEGSHCHRRWWALVARIEITYGYTRKEAEACELAAIRGEEPLFNVAGAVNPALRKAGLWEAA